MSTNNSRLNIQLLIVDPQNDFCVEDEKVTLPDGTEVSTGNKGALCVPGGHEDMTRLATMIDRVGPKLDDIHVTMDSHQTIGIERPRWWKRVGDGAPPNPFTILGIHTDRKRIVSKTPQADGSLLDTDEEYTTYMPSYLHSGGPTGKGVFGYFEALEAKGRYPHVVWTVHCVVGTWGWSIVPELAAALGRWEHDQFARVDYVPKGNNPWTEHFSGVQAEVPDPADPSTQVNTGLVTTMEEADIIPVGGEALSHCDANTVRDIIKNFSDSKYAEKIVLLMDAMSNVSGFEFLGDAFVKEVTAKGVKTSTTIEFLA